MTQDGDAPSETGGGQRNRRGRPGRDQADILHGAITVFNRQGYDGTSMGDIAAELGVVKSAIYHHVPSKEHLLAAALDEALEQLTTTVEAATSGTDGSAYQRLRTVVHDSVLILIAHLPAVTLLLRVRGNSRVEQEALRRRRALDEQLARLYADAVAEGSVRADVDPVLASRLIFGMVNSLVEWYRPDGSTDPETLADAMVRTAFDGLTA